jgi:hypothetical protein
MFGFKQHRKIETPNQPRRPVLEALESRTLRSASAATTMRSDLGGSASTSTSFQGYTPAQILKSHGFDTVGYDTATGPGTAKATAVQDAVIGTAANTGTIAATVTPSTTVVVAPRSVDWHGNGQATIVITNLGNVTAAGELNLALYASPEAVLDASAVLLKTITKPNVKISPGMSITLEVHFKVPIAAVGGTYDLIGSVTSFTTPFDGYTSNDIAVIGTVRA